ncbi:P1 family peptidase [Corynebacterium sp. TAE3-ERU12]|uniref:P1 family peptidase n=1 Tax=Corynebacterium sp. TAE3-ERU12 TaxID=2849491 RepID=UPI001C45EF81|nr:P1 family peptidase [Corynebacterium sp. TAE3-ERU12]MBV7294879.1 P1 family peptidase [Corynebacterium sp. TAE3-ERU12]
MSAQRNPQGAAAVFGGRADVGADAFAEATVGVRVGHASSGDTGVTVLIPDVAAIGAVDVRGGGPGTRETDLLDPSNTVQRVHAIALCGGSAPGLAAADGVLAALRDNGVGVQVSEDHPDIRIPVVPAAVIFDLLVGAADAPDAELGRAAFDAASAGPAQSGSVGAGTAAMAGALKGGVGQAVVRFDSGAYVAAVVVANPLGAVVGPDNRLYGDPDWGTLDSDARAGLDTVFVGLTKVLRREEGSDSADSAASAASDGAASALNTTIGAVITNAPVTAAQARRLAMAGHDGMARAIRPSHLPFDGDTLFCLGDVGSGTEDNPAGVSPEQLAGLSAAAADAVQFAIVDAVRSATSRGGVLAFAEHATAAR